MCGVIGMASERHRKDLGLVAAELLKTLEYRGYDSTGAALQGEGEEIVLRKGVGAPSVMVERLGIVGLAGSILCGQVRWATFGSVDDLNAQPHEVRCKTHLYGAHNGNVTNCDDLKAWLTSQGHRVLSDNDGEMLVHTVEHQFAAELTKTADRNDPAQRRAAMRSAVVLAGARLKGSYAAVVVDPQSRTLWAVKQGSSLYFGVGRHEMGGAFAIASSDLSSVLKLTRVLVPMAEGEFMEYTSDNRQLYALRAQGARGAGAPIERAPTRSRLQAKDAALLPPFTSFMEQEIAAQEETCRRIAALFGGGSEATRTLSAYVDEWPAEDRREIARAVSALRDEYDEERIRRRFEDLVALPAWRRAVAAVPGAVRAEGTNAPAEELAHRLVSAEAGLLSELLAAARSPEEAFSVRLLDVLVEREEIVEFEAVVKAFVEAARTALARGGRVFLVCCGSSYHASLSGAVFFNELARAEVVPVLPGEFRGRFAKSLRAEDVVVAVSQSGETKDLIDVMNQVIGTGLPIRRIGLVNNVSSTLGQEKCEAVLPLRCGPEVAVPATKSYMNQLAMLYALAIRLGQARLDTLAVPASEREALRADLDRRARALDDLARLVRETLATTGEAVDQAAQALFLRPSLHVLGTRLIGVAKEGALKIREVVLNHAEGFEASEFKHGPNTILGVSTIFGIEEVLRFAEKGRVDGRWDFDLLRADHPLVFVTGPDETDVNLTVSQVNTHKIRGATCVMVAEESSALRQAVTKPPTDNPRYRAVYVTLPATGDNLMVVFTATVVLQRLALQMSLRKREHLDRLGFADHGVHPDVPKNVSKSITVD